MPWKINPFTGKPDYYENSGATPTDTLLIAGDVISKFIVTGFTSSVTGTDDKVTISPGIAYVDGKRVEVITDTVLTVTNTGAAHYEYVSLDTNGQLIISTTLRDFEVPDAIAIADVSVDASGIATSVVDVRDMRVIFKEGVPFNFNGKIVVGDPDYPQGYDLQLNSSYVAFGIDSSGVYYNQAKAALHIGGVGTDAWSDVNTGVASLTVGFNNIASGTCAISLGKATQALADYSFVIGTGLNLGTPLVNNIPNSLLIGFNSNPIFFADENHVSIKTTTPNSTFEVAGSVAFTQTTVTADTTLDDSYFAVFADASAAPLTLTLPSADTCPTRIYVIKKIDDSANTVTITTATDLETIDGATSISLGTQYDFRMLQSDGANWFIIGM